jgi:hypothetical protein
MLGFRLENGRSNTALEGLSCNGLPIQRWLKVLFSFLSHILLHRQRTEYDLLLRHQSCEMLDKRPWIHRPLAHGEMQAAVPLRTIVEDYFSKFINCDCRLSLNEEPSLHCALPLYSQIWHEEPYGSN